MFRSKTFTVRRRFSDFLGLYEKLSEKHSQNGYIVPPPPEKSILGKNLLCWCIRSDLIVNTWLIWINVCGFDRYDESQSWEGGPIVSRVCGTEESSSREVRHSRWHWFLSRCSEVNCWILILLWLFVLTNQSCQQCGMSELFVTRSVSLFKLSCLQWNLIDQKSQIAAIQDFNFNEDWKII